MLLRRLPIERDIDLRCSRANRSSAPHIRNEVDCDARSLSSPSNVDQNAWRDQLPGRKLFVRASSPHRSRGKTCVREKALVRVREALYRARQQGYDNGSVIRTTRTFDWREFLTGQASHERRSPYAPDFFQYDDDARNTRQKRGISDGQSSGSAEENATDIPALSAMRAAPPAVSRSGHAIGNGVRTCEHLTLRPPKGGTTNLLAFGSDSILNLSLNSEYLQRRDCPLNARQRLFFANDLQQMVEARAGGISGEGEAQRMD